MGARYDALVQALAGQTLIAVGLADVPSPPWTLDTLPAHAWPGAPAPVTLSPTDVSDDDPSSVGLVGSVLLAHPPGLTGPVSLSGCYIITSDILPLLLLVITFTNKLTTNNNKEYIGFEFYVEVNKED